MDVLRTICKGKIHRASVTEADLNYTGSITIDYDLMEAADIRPYEMVHVNNVSNAATWRTYAIPSERGSGRICLNGPPARLFQPKDQVIILSLGIVSDSEYQTSTSNIVFVNSVNQILRIERHQLWDLFDEHSR